MLLKELDARDSHHEWRQKKQPERPGKADFSIDDFITEIEKAEDIEASKPLPQQRLRNARALDRAEAAEAKRKTTKTSNPETKTGMSKKNRLSPRRTR